MIEDGPELHPEKRSLQVQNGAGSMHGQVNDCVCLARALAVKVIAHLDFRSSIFPERLPHENYNYNLKLKGIGEERMGHRRAEEDQETVLGLAMKLISNQNLPRLLLSAIIALHFM